MNNPKATPDAKTISNILDALRREQRNHLEHLNLEQVLKHIIKERNDAFIRRKKDTGPEPVDKETNDIRNLLARAASRFNLPPTEKLETLKRIIESEAGWRQRCGSLIVICRRLIGKIVRHKRVIMEMAELTEENDLTVYLLEEHLENMQHGE